MKIRRVLGLAMACSMVFSQPVFADEQGKNSSYPQLEIAVQSRAGVNIRQFCCGED